jgi:hypothetical protein
MNLDDLGLRQKILLSADGTVTDGAITEQWPASWCTDEAAAHLEPLTS